MNGLMRPADGVQIYTPKAAVRTMRMMQRFVDQGIRDPNVVHLANQVIAGRRPRDYAGQIDAIRRFMSGNFFFVDNPIGTQRVQPPASMLEDIAGRGITQGACNDAATLIATLGMANGLYARFRAIAFGRATGYPSIDDAVPYNHVVTDLFDGRQWVTVDATRPYELWRDPSVVRVETLDL